jgi:hypothetical protein
LAADLLHGRGVRHENGVVLVLTRNGQPFGQHRTHNLAGHVFDAHDLPDGIFDAEKLIAHGSTDHADVGGSLNVVLRKGRALVDVPALDVEVFGRNAAVSGVPVLIAIDDLDSAVDVGRDALNQGHLILDGNSVAHNQGLRAVGAGAPAIDGAAARFDPNEIVAEIVELLFDASLAGFADGHDANHRSDANGDAEDGQHAAQFVAQQGDHG